MWSARPSMKPRLNYFSRDSTMVFKRLENGFLMKRIHVGNGNNGIKELPLTVL